MSFLLFAGGIHSGKSKLAVKWAEAAAPHRLLLALPLQPIRRQERGLAPEQGWERLSDPLEPLSTLNQFLESHAGFAGSIVLDSIGSWIANLMLQNLQGKDILRRVAALSRALEQTALPCAIVTDEAGLTPPPAASVTKKFASLLGVANQILARDSHCAIMVLCGLPLLLKGSMPAILDRALRSGQ